ncbi:MAG: rRNA maturation RNase YbeY [Alphaproteobacteria bacterium]|nr:rRNA maturation RNase YbeY [Alphaproteobacteria bacterium]
MRTSPLLCLEIELASWHTLKALAKTLKAARLAVQDALPVSLQPIAQKAQVTLLLTSDKKIRALNKAYRGVDKATNVLSFPQYERKDLPAAARLSPDVLYLGDIAATWGVVIKESKAEGKMPLHHVTHLFIHGLLHLWGYDHDTPARASRMEKMERQIMKTLDLPDPYILGVRQKRT